MKKRLYLVNIILIVSISLLSLAIAIYGLYYMGYSVNWYLTNKDVIDELPYGRQANISEITQYAVYSAFLLIIFSCFLTVLLISIKQHKQKSSFPRIKEVIVYDILPLIGVILGIVCAAHWTPRISEYIHSLEGSSIQWQEVGTVLWFLYGFTGIFTAVFGATALVLNNLLYTTVINSICLKINTLKNRRQEERARLQEERDAAHKAEKIAALEKELLSLKLAERITELEKELEELKRDGK